MRPRKHHLLLAAALVGVVAVVPAVASSEAGPTVSGLESIMWSPTQVTVAGGATVSFQNTSGSVPHGVVWETGNPETPACSGVPIDEGQTNWKGSCTFTKAGVYRYYCSVHGMAMSGTIVVGTPATTPAPPPPTPTTPTAPAPPPTPTEVAPAEAGLTSPLAGSAAKAIALAANQHGQSVRGSIRVSSAGVGARLEIDLLAAGTAPTASRRSAEVRLGELIRTSLKSGRVSFAVPLNRQGRAALHRRGRLALAARIMLTPTRGVAVYVTRAVVMHASDRHA
jgi:plastocyanin